MPYDQALSRTSGGRERAKDTARTLRPGHRAARLRPSISARRQISAAATMRRRRSRQPRRGPACATRRHRTRRRWMGRAGATAPAIGGGRPRVSRLLRRRSSDARTRPFRCTEVRLGFAARAAGSVLLRGDRAAQLRRGISVGRERFGAARGPAHRTRVHELLRSRPDGDAALALHDRRASCARVQRPTRRDEAPSAHLEAGLENAGNPRTYVAEMQAEFTGAFNLRGAGRAGLSFREKRQPGWEPRE